MDSNPQPAIRLPETDAFEYRWNYEDCIRAFFTESYLRNLIMANKKKQPQKKSPPKKRGFKKGKGKGY